MNHNIPLNRSVTGMVLLEVLMYSGIFAVLINILMSAYLNATRLSNAGIARAEIVRMTEDTRTDMTRAIHEAATVIPSLDAFKTRKDLIVLQMPQTPDATTRRYTVLGHIRSDKRLSRMEIVERNGQQEVTFLKTYAIPVTDVQFSTDPHLQNRLITVDLKSRLYSKNQSWQFSTALRGVEKKGNQS